MFRCLTRKFLPLFITTIVVVLAFIGWATISPGDELGFIVSFFGVLIPFCGAGTGAWYGVILRGKTKWLIPVGFYMLELLMLCTFDGKFSIGTVLEYAPIGLIAGIPCLIGMGVGNIYAKAN